MADYLRQLRNDEKRAIYALVGTLDDKNLDTNHLEYSLLSIPEKALPIRGYIVVTEAFPAGSTLDLTIVEGDAIGEIWATALDLTVVGVTQSLVTDRGAVYKAGNILNSLLSQVAVDANVGKVKVVLEYTEQPVTTGKYAT